MNRRGFLGAILAAAVAPAVVKAESIMRVRPIVLPGEVEFNLTFAELVDHRAAARAALEEWWSLQFDRLMLKHLAELRAEPLALNRIRLV